MTEPVETPEPQTPFRRRTLWILGAVVAVSLVAVVGLAVIGGDLGGRPSTGADAYSRSALGHHGLVALLEDRGVPVLVSQSSSATKAAKGLLVLAEPALAVEGSERRLAAMLGQAPRVLVVLPKWWGLESPTRPGWLDDVALLPGAEVGKVVSLLGLDGARVARGEAAMAVDGLAIAVAPQYLAVDGDWDRPRVADGERAYVVEVQHGATVVTVITDPDLLNNHGLDEGGNAPWVVGLIDELRQGGPVVFDEITHGYVREPSLFALLFRYPLVLATLQALLTAIVLGLAARGRFGPPAAVPPPVAAGKDFLIAHTANLLRHGGHDAAMLRRYLTASVQQVRASLHAPRELAGAQLASWLERIGAARKVSVPLAELEREVASVEADSNHHKRAPAVAARIHRWRQEMTLGSGNHP